MPVNTIDDLIVLIYDIRFEIPYFQFIIIEKGGFLYEIKK
ncbi:MAG: hypothetical protein K0R34_1272 [Herbinix sp.]|jgi:hypothetical protein|nr:hypothetical protein [Herbinix sp.]